MRRVLLTIVTASLAATMFFVPSAAAQTEAAPDAEAKETDELRPPRPRIRCHGAITLMNGEPKAVCAWTETEHPDAAGYKLIRRAAGERSVVFRTGDLSTTTFTDTNVEFNTRYRYRVVVVDENGRRLQRSRWNRAFVLSPDTERLHLDCVATDTDRAETDPAETDRAETDKAPTKPVLCEWEPAESKAAVEYQLWRRVRGHHRELVVTTGLDVLSHVDDVPADTGKVIYAVLALDADGEIVGRSAISKVRWPVTDS